MYKEHFRNKLLKLREELHRIEESGNDAAKTVELDQTCVGRLSRMDAMQAQAMSVESKRRREIKEKRIESALQRVDTDDFGYCVRCEEEIDPKRLEFDPSALLCIECANKGER